MLSIKESLVVYNLISPFLEDSIFNDDLFDFSSTILDKIIASEQHEVFIQLASILLKKEFEDLVSMDMNEFVPDFLVSLVDNRVVDLVEFYRGLNA